MSNLLKDARPDLAKEWHPARNSTVSVDTITDDSDMKVWWQCVVNPHHEWPAAVRRRVQTNTGCPYCKGRRLDPDRSLAVLRPVFAAEWHPRKNGALQASQVGLANNKKVWWLCAKGHEWQAPVSSRVRNNLPCPKCRLAATALTMTHPALAAQWHPTRNGALSPNDVTFGMRRKVWWKCDKGHEWPSMISTRVRLRSECPRCWSERERAAPRSLADADPELARQWHPTKNGTLTPRDVGRTSRAKVWWVCADDSAHEWPAIVRNRARLGSGCPYCKKTLVTTANSLATKYPRLAAEWFQEKNGDLRPEHVLPGSAKLVWWRCSRNPAHVWDTTITSRTQGGRSRGCPYCSGQAVSPENCLANTYPQIAAEWHPTRNGALTPTGVTRASAKKVWWKCAKNPAHEWEALVKNRTLLDTGCPDCDAEAKVIRIQESLWDSRQPTGDSYELFNNALRNIQRLANARYPAHWHLDQPQRRLLYAAVITAMESYLYETFRQFVLADDILLGKLIQSTPEFAERKWAITDVLDWHKNLRSRAEEYLFNVLWHNLPKVRSMYRETLGVDFPPRMDRLMTPIAARHDIVHRNGYRREGGIRFLTKRSVEYVANDARGLVEHLESQIREKHRTKPPTVT
jgi:hypothetical protein